MPIKILLADKSITIQKVVEMLFSGREYEVACVSDGETALAEAGRVMPDVVLADVDLPRIDGYSFAARLKQTPPLAQTPVILMMSRDDVFDSAKGAQTGISDHIAKPFESQELIGKVKKALASAPPRPGEPAPAAAVVKTAPAPAASPPKPKQPADIFDIIQEAPTQAELKGVAPAAEDEAVFYEVEPEVEEAEEHLVRESAKVLPVGVKAMEEMRAGLGLAEDKAAEDESEIVPFEAFDLAMETAPKVITPAAPKPATPEIAAPQARPQIPAPTASDQEIRIMVEESVAKAVREAFEKMQPTQAPAVSASDMWSIAEETVAKMAKDVFAQMPVQPQAQPTVPKISEDTIRRGIEEAVMKVAREIARDVIEKVAWEVIPQLAEHLITAEIEKLKAME